MRILLDTHAFLWFFVGDERLSQVARSAIESSDHENFLSVASLWEIAIKTSLGKLHLASSFEAVMTQALAELAISVLPITLRQLVDVAQLPFHHRDPFDRLIAAQARTEKLIVVSGDEVFDSYGVNRWW